MSALIYRAPDSTGIGIFGDDREPLRARKSLGSVAQLIEVLVGNPIYPNPFEDVFSLWSSGSVEASVHERQRKLLEFEGLPLDAYEDLLQGKRHYPTFDELVDSSASPPVTLSPGWPGRPEPLPVFYARSDSDLRALINELINRYDLSIVAIKSIIRHALSKTFSEEQGSTDVHLKEILSVLEGLFEKLFYEQQVAVKRALDYSQLQQHPSAEEELWHYLSKTPIQIPSDYDRDGVRCVFRLLDAALLSQLHYRPDLHKDVQEILLTHWPQSDRIMTMDWATLYQMEKGTNVFGLAAASALARLQLDELLPHLGKSFMEKQAVNRSVVPGHTDPMSLRYFSLPILSQGRWALQAPVNTQNAHPFFDAAKRRMIVLNGQFNPEVEEELRDFVRQVVRYSPKSENSSEYFSLIWGYFFELLSGEKKRYEAIKTQIEGGLEEYGLGSQSIDYQIFHRVKGKSPEELDELAFLEAVRRTTREGGQIAVAGISLQSPRRLYVASHNRPVFIVRRIDNDDFMVVSDINAAMGLFPQSQIHETTLELRRLKRREVESIAGLQASGATKAAVRACKKQYQEEENRLLNGFKVSVFHLEGEEVFARIFTDLLEGELIRSAKISDFEGNPQLAIEPFFTVLNPLGVGKDMDRSFYETHLHEIPDRLDDILRYYISEEDGLPHFDLREPLLRRRFGKGLGELRRVVLVGIGSAYNVGLMARNFLQNMLPSIEVEVLRAVEIESVPKMIVQEKDLVILLSWSGTTASMVQLAKDLSEHKAVMIGITEKRFSDMGLVAEKNGGVISVLSGEEVTISALKSTMCMLLCLDLFGVWLSFKRGHKKKALLAMGKLLQLPDRTREILQDETIEAFSKLLASRSVHTYACVVIDALHSMGSGRELALKVEETSWTAIGKSLEYGDVVVEALKRGKDRKFVLVNATCGARIQEALSVMKRLYLAGVPFTAVSYANGKQAEIEDYSQGQCIWLPKLEDDVQPFVDLVFDYILAFHYGIAHGRSVEDFPRNRTKSVTAATNFRKEQLTPAAEIFRLQQRERLAPGIPLEREAFSAESTWEKKASHDWEKSYYREIRRLGQEIHGGDPLRALIKSGTQNVGQLSKAIFERLAEEREIIFVPFDRPAAAVSRDMASQWGRFWGASMRVAPPSKTLSGFSRDALLILVASKTPEWRAFPNLLRGVDSRCVWFGPQIPREKGKIFERALGCFQLEETPAFAENDFLYAGLSFLFIKAWKNQDPAKAETLERHLRKNALFIQRVLNDLSLKQSILDTIAVNGRYETAFFVGPPAGTGLAWVHRFDEVGWLTMEQYFYGESIHGPLVTVDPRVEEKFVRIRERTQMVSIYGEDQVSAWEDQYLGGESTDIFLSLPNEFLSNGDVTPFFAEGQWYFPALRNEYDATHDNLIILDATAGRYFGKALDELSTYGCRYARMIVISQEAFRTTPESRALHKFPISHLLLLPALAGREGEIPVSTPLLPFVMNLVGTALAAAQEAAPRTSHEQTLKSTPAAAPNKRSSQREKWMDIIEHRSNDK
jgi:glucosamine 6-phosphate synthetase-like amidotransferase/phosphosugar isomerase protein